MMEMYGLLKRLVGDSDADADHPCYAEADVKSKATETFDLHHDGLLAVLVDGVHVSFVVFEFHSSDADGKNKRLARVFHGSGPSGSLRELRHTHWGDDGYVFYPSAKTIAEAFAHLAKWFDV